MSSTNKTTYYELSQYVGSDKPTYLGDYNADMLKIDTGLHAAADAADTAVTTANAANSAATSASTTASTALSTAQTASTTASQAQTTAETALTNSGAAQTAAEEAETAARANVITNLAPAYDPSLTYDVGNLVTYIDAQGSGKMYKCIVAVTTPEAFNINKWDDVTTTEVYKKDSRIVSSVTVDSALSFGDVLTALANGFTIDPDKEYKLVMDTVTAKSYCVGNNNYKETASGHKSIVFTEISLQRDPYNLINDTFIIGSYNKFIRTVTDSTGSVTYTDATTATAGIGTYEIYEI